MTKCINNPKFRNAQAKRAFELLLKNDSVVECGINDSRQIYIIWTDGFVGTYSRYDFIKRAKIYEAEMVSINQLIDGFVARYINIKKEKV